MCLAIPLKLIEVQGELGKVEMGGVSRRVNLAFVEGVQPGDFVVVHAGFAIARLDEEEAAKTLAMLDAIARGEEG